MTLPAGELKAWMVFQPVICRNSLVLTKKYLSLIERAVFEDLVSFQFECGYT